MKTLKLTVLSLLIVLTACKSDNIKNISSINMSSQVSKLDLFQTFPMSEKYLLGTWQLKDSPFKDNENKPLTLKFEQGEVLVLNGCNNLRANYEIKDGRLTVASPISTRMMCEENLMQIDNLASKLLTGQIILEKFVDSLPEHSYLKITLDGKEYKFNRVK
ncbi:META domain-containing protein [Moraxella sp. ZY210820]|uniref:META domain-containing protein n=1 Tax=unclassified Moraxella TaxID=2685852 RepID=UPI0027318CAB|nr:META domain-containing protein [Moraxella sp. ZY210820]WLF84571.1 META domain-containing protein [Moraxella sp. ZY210820]